MPSAQLGGAVTTTALPPMPVSHTGLLLKVGQVLQEVLHVCHAVADVGESSYLLGHGIQGGFDLQQRKTGSEHLCLTREPMLEGQGMVTPEAARDEGHPGPDNPLRPAEPSHSLTS